MNETVSKLPAPTAEVEAILECFSTLDRFDALGRVRNAIIDLRSIARLQMRLADVIQGGDEYVANLAATSLASLTAVESYLAGGVQ